MPLYEFWCESCGPFEERRPFSRATYDTSCPACQGPATRVITPPNLRRLQPPVRHALEREEKSRHEPEVVRRATPGAGRQRRRVGGRPWTVGG
jgi:putative FmdB family regulatory protein